MNKYINSLLLACATSLLLAGSYIGSLYLQPFFHPYAYTAARCGFATLFLLPFMTMDEFRWLTPYRLLLFLGAGIFGFFLNNQLFTVALQYASATNISIINATLPTMVLLTSCIIFKKYPSLNEIAGFVCSFIGVLLIISKKDFSGMFTLQKGELMMLLANCAGVANALLLQKLGENFSALFLTALGSCIGMIFLLPMGIHSDLISQMGNLGGFEWLVLLAVAGFCTALPFWGQSVCILSLGASTATFLISGLVPVFVSILAFVCFGESITMMQLLGGMLVIVAIYFNLRNKVFVPHSQSFSR